MKVKLSTLPNQVAGVLARRIATDEFANGLVPSEVQICIEFGVSRAVAREALKILRALDIVDIAQGRRVTVRPISEWDYMSPLLVEWLPSAQVHELLRELHEARVVFEPAIAAKAARNLTDSELARLGDLLDAMAASEHDADRYLTIDLQFHVEICSGSRNRILDRFMYSSRWWQSASRRISNQAPRALPMATEQHRNVYEALAARDPERAEEAMRKHLLTNSLFIVLAEEEEVQ